MIDFKSVISISQKSGFISKEKNVSIFDANKKPFYIRENVKGVFNLPKGFYYTNNTLKRTKPRNYNSKRLPKKERKRSIGNFSICFEDNNPNKCQINTFTNEIFIDRTFWNGLNRTQKTAVLLHEIGHYFYSTESFCDLFATKEMLKEGYNPSQIAKAFIETLDAKRNEYRKKNIYKRYLNNSYNG